MTDTFAYSQPQLAALASSVISLARDEGATDAQVDFSQSNGLLIEMRQGRVRSRTRDAQSSMSLTVYRGDHQGTARSTDFSPARLRETVQAACRIASYTGEDQFTGLAAVEFLCQAPQELDLWHPWDVDEARAIHLAQRIETGMNQAGSNVESDGAWVRSGQSSWFLMNSRGFAQGDRQTEHLLSAKALATKDGRSQLAFWSSHSHRATSLMTPETIGLQAGSRALAALDIAPLNGGRRCPVLFDPGCALTLLEHLVQATSGAALYHRNSFLADQLGQRVFSSHISIEEDPFVPQGLASRSFDGDGIAGSVRRIVDQGNLAAFFLSAYAARRLGMVPTGSGWGPGNLSLHSSQTKAGDDFAAMLKKLDTGLLVTRFTGGGARLINGDYSRSLQGFWVENGKLCHAVDGVTIAGNLKQMFNQIVAVGADRFTQGALTSGSVLIDNLQVAGR
ncbi:TldD/PmbA family protein [Biostraticola tofi]|uniref:PmbA protein n=1 Tax=Biostraticola tofi TaxID=466109 RepID=A0A4R3YLQ6_9GAMM|nr:metallopeptidase TldD-related protein [Biostraticola tofi]TCV93527.1 PmbA protein [Biostraticola tofi]